MDLGNLATRAADALVYAATSSALAVPFWVAVSWLVLLLIRRPLIWVLCRGLGIDDRSVEKALVSRIDAPLKLLLVLLACVPFIQMIPGGVGDALMKVVRCVLPFLAFHVLIQGTDLAVFKWYLEHWKDVKLPGVVRFAFLTVAYAALVLMLLDWALGVDVVPLLATSTVVTAVLGFALQDTLKNFFAGLTLSFERTFRQGDWVLIQQNAGSNVVGEIIEIGWRSTRIRTPNNDYIIVPNSQFITGELVNYNSPASQHACELEFDLKVDVEPARVKETLEGAAAGADGVLAQPQPQAFVKTWKADQLVYSLRFWVQRFEDREQTTSAVLERVWQSLRDARLLSTADKSP